MDQELKQRLTGAIVLVSLAVIFVPVILEGPRDEWAPRDHKIPDPPDLAYEVPSELPVPPVRSEAIAVPPAAGQVSEETPAATVKSAPVPVVQAPPPPKVKKTIKPESKQQIPVPASGWYVQVGSFSQPENADRLRDSLRTKGLDAHRYSVKTGGGAGYRVIVGPSGTRPQAEKLQEKLAGSHKLKGIVIETGATAGK